MKSLPVFFVLISASQPVMAEDPLVQPVIDACIDKLDESDRTTRPAGQVVDSMYSEAGSMIILQDADGRMWKCFGYKDGTVETLEPADAAESEAALARSDAQDALAPRRIGLADGTSGAEISGELEAGGATQFVLAARKGQVLDLRIEPRGGEMYYILRNPDGSVLQGGTDAVTAYRQPLSQSGDHVIEVINKESASHAFDLRVTIE
ncbi:hypothetical protein RGQ15_21220 [Paracoccus sp. MBLB3053]|uniref:Uncharacterized protein n=1 Tax=Paracoccus aurantius TaxID=3073814 RepID=A0ABU2HYG8_9RHOB|nr:hypothetical protein [Paracoccus sp. MBLB3053]MDS9470076.1 hypothetical protein [Paracoccus sp. MBLB3053]